MSTDTLGISSAFSAGRAALPQLPSRLDKLARDASPTEQARTAAQEDFASILSQSVAARAGGAANKTASEMTPDEKKAQSRQAAQDFVAVAFIQPILKQLRNSSIGGELPPPLGPGPGEKQFRTLADTQVARQLARAGNWPLVDTLTKNLQSGAGSPGSKTALANAAAQHGSPADIKIQAAAREAARLAALHPAPNRNLRNLLPTLSRADINAATNLVPRPKAPTPLGIGSLAPATQTSKHNL